MAPPSHYTLTWVTNQLAVGAAPMSYEDLESLKREGIDAILNLCSEFCDLHWLEADQGFEVYYLPIEDESAPDMEALERGLDWLDEVIYLGKNVLIHCRHGLGRTGTVLNSYLLRKGLGHKLADKRLKKLKAKPQNFSQWRFIRKYGKRSGRLHLREPNLEMKNQVNLYPFFTDVERAAEIIDSYALKQDVQSHCGKDHDRCCRAPFSVGLAEAVYIKHMINLTLGRTERQSIVAAAVQSSAHLRRTQITDLDLSPENASESETDPNICPLSEYGECLIFEHRPLRCRLSDIPDALPKHSLEQRIHQNMVQTSNALFFAFVSSFPGEKEKSYFFPDVISGRFVQIFFHDVLESEKTTENTNFQQKTNK